MGTLSRQLEAIKRATELAPGHLSEKNSRLCKLWSQALDQEFLFVIDERSVESGSQESATQSALWWLFEVVARNALRSMTSVLFTVACGHNRRHQFADIPVEFHEGSIHFYQNDLRWLKSRKSYVVQLFGGFVFDVLLTDAERHAYQSSDLPLRDGRDDFHMLFSDLISADFDSASQRLPATLDDSISKRAGALQELLKPSELAKRVDVARRATYRLYPRVLDVDQDSAEFVLTSDKKSSTIWRKMSQDSPPAPSSPSGDQFESASQDVGLYLRNLVATHLAHKQIDVVGAVDQLLALTDRLGHLHCALAGTNRLCFKSHDAPLCDVELDNARTKIRILCARLAAIGNSAGERFVSPYGDQAQFDYLLGTDRRVGISLQFVNTPGHHEFTVAALGHLAPPEGSAPHPG